MTDPSKIFDGLLVLQYRAGSKKALSLLASKYHTKLCRHSFCYTLDIEVSKDIVQDCWKIIINKIDSLKDPNLFGSWAFRIVTRKSLDLVSKKKRELQKLRESFVMASNDAIETDIEEPIKKLRHAILTLSIEQQMVLRLFYIENYALKEIAEILEISIGTVKSRLFHAREKLKQILNK